MTEFNKKIDEIAIIAPASSADYANAKLQQAISLLNSHGFKCQYDANIFADHDSLEYLASTKENRLKQLKDALENPKVKIIWAFRGGYGTTEIVIDCLNYKPSGPKILIGFSDITALHVLFNQHYEMPSIHGPVLTSVLYKQVEMLEYIISVLQGENINISLEPFNGAASNFKNLIPMKIVGGNLAIYCNMIGTKLHPKTSGKILFFEDVKEKGYNIHRYLVHIKNAGLFENVTALILGDFTETSDDLEQSLTSFCREHIPQIPTFRARGIGHENVNYPIVSNGDAVIEENKLRVFSPFKLV